MPYSKPHTTGVRWFSNGWLPFFGILLLLTFGTGPSAFGEGEEDEVNRRELVRFLVHLDPAQAGAEEFFERLKTDPAFRQSIASQLETGTPRALKKAADRGNQFRTDYADLLGSSFGRDDEPLAPYAQQPTVHLRRSFEQFLRAQRGVVQQKLPEYQVNELARSFAARKSSLSPTSPMEVFQERGTQPNQDFNRGRLYFEDETEPRRKNKPFASPPTLALWKQHLRAQLQRARGQNLKGTIVAISEANEDSKVRILPVDPATLKPRKGKRHSLKFKDLKEYSVEWVETPGTELQWIEPNTWFSSTRNGAEASGPAVRFKRKPGAKGPEEFLVPAESVVRLAESFKRHLVLGNSPASTKLYMRFVEEAIERERELRENQQLLQSNAGENSDQFAQRLTQVRGALGAGDQSLTRQIVEHGAQDWGASEGEKILQGLEWYGFLEGGDHWWRRDQTAAKKGRGEWSRTHRGSFLGNRIRALKNKVASLGKGTSDHLRYDLFTRTILPVALAAPFVGVGIGYLLDEYGDDTVRPYVERMREWVHENIGSWGSGGEDGFRMREGNLATNDGRGGPGEGPPLWNITHVPEGTRVPHHFDVPWPDNTRSNKIPLEFGKVPANAWHGESATPHYPDDRGIVALPRPHGDKMVAFELFEGGELGGDPLPFTVYQDPESGLYFAHIEGDYDGPVSFQAKYAPAPTTLSDAFKADLPLAQATVQGEIDLLRNAGFTEIADELQRKLDAATAEGRSLLPGEAARAIDSMSYYTYQREKIPGGIRDGNPYTQWSHFLKNGKMCAQCDGSNQLLQKFLSRAYHYDPDIEVENRWTFVRGPGHKTVTQGGSHLRTELQRDGEQLTLDATPHARNPDDPEPEDKYPKKPAPVHREPLGPIVPDFFVERRRLPHVVHEPRPTVPPGDHERRLAELKKHLDGLIDSPFFRNIPQAHLTRDPVPPVRAVRLARQVELFASGELTWVEFTEAVEGVLPGLDLKAFNDPSELPKLITEAVAAHLKEWKDGLPVLRRTRNNPYGYLENEMLMESSRQLTDFLTRTDWTPVRYKEEADPIAPGSRCQLGWARIGHGG